MMEIIPTQKTAVEFALEKLRKESEARAILQDLEMLITMPVERKRRWVWELMQNAKDCATKNEFEESKVNISFLIEEKKLTFTHDGNPFTLEELLALVRRTSTKSYDMEDGKTGKFGTGFITTHVLNRKVKVTGVLKNEKGLRPFQIHINRTHETLEALQIELDEVFSKINDFHEQLPQYIERLPLTKYEYELEPETLQLAIDSIEELKRNLPFTLLINKSIKSLNIKDETRGIKKTYTIDNSIEVFPGVLFSRLLNGVENEHALINGLFHYSFDKSTIAVPAERQGDNWRIKQIEKQARLYREFPLVGTELWHIPFFLQSGDLLPSEPRDGVRTIKDNESKEDKTADENRSVFVKYCIAVKDFFEILHSYSIEDSYLIAESGLPDEKTEYTSKEWFCEYIQKPLRLFFIDHSLVKTTSGNSIAINKAKFPFQFPENDINNQFYSIAVKFYPSQFPDETSFKDWQRIISQETSAWGEGLLCEPEDLIKEVSSPEGFSTLKLLLGDSYIEWLDSLIIFVNKFNKGENYCIYPNQEGNLKRKQELRVDPGLNDKIKSIGNRLNQSVYEQLLHTGISKRDGIDIFNTKGFFDVLNTYIGSLTPSVDAKSEYEAVFELVCMFNDSYAKERERWFQLAKQLLPDMVHEKIVVFDMGEFNYDSAELASLKYICWIIEQKVNFQSFTETFFQQNNTSAYEWLNNFIDVLFRNQKYEELIRKYAVIPMQNGCFRKLEIGIFREDINKPFDLLIKELFSIYSTKGNANNFLIAIEITNENILCATPDLLTKPIDDLFCADDIEKQVEPEGILNPLFHKINEWIGKNEGLSELLFPHFYSHRPMLYIKAFGPDVSKMVVALLNMKKPMEELQALANLNMSATELGQLVIASEMAGGINVLLEFAETIEREAKDAEWRKNVGDAAEDAFAEAIGELNAFDIENPDRGYDFEIMQLPQNNSFFLEIKSTVQYKESIQMSSLQGRTARDNPQKYALCVVSRIDANDQVNKEYFIERAKFRTDIGMLVSSKVDGIEDGLKTIRLYKSEGEVSTALENEKYSVFVGKKIWDKGINFHEFVNHLKIYFNLYVIKN